MQYANDLVHIPLSMYILIPGGQLPSLEPWADPVRDFRYY